MSENMVERLARDDVYLKGNIHWQRLFAVYTPPASHVAAEAQRPAHLVDGYTLAVAYQRDCRNARRSAIRSGEKG